MTVLQRLTVRSRLHRGSVLIEFAIVALLLYLIIAAVFTFGHALFIAESMQHTVDLFAHELARTPLPPDYDLATALQDPTVKSTIFDQQYLDIDISEWQTGNTRMTLDSWLQYKGVPMINRLLAPLMIIDLRTDGTYHLWYPGAVQDSNGNYYVNILAGDGSQPPTTYPVIEAVQNPDSMPLSPTDTSTPNPMPSGMVGIRLNYPYQSAFLSSYTYAVDGVPVSSPAGQDGHVSNSLITANEGYDSHSTTGGLYTGEDNLGQQVVGNRIARPFQRLISTQAVYRRTVFSSPTTTPTTGP